MTSSPTRLARRNSFPPFEMVGRLWASKVQARRHSQHTRSQGAFAGPAVSASTTARGRAGRQIPQGVQESLIEAAQPAEFPEQGTGEPGDLVTVTFGDDFFAIEPPKTHGRIEAVPHSALAPIDDALGKKDYSGRTEAAPHSGLAPSRRERLQFPHDRRAKLRYRAGRLRIVHVAGGRGASRRRLELRLPLRLDVGRQSAPPSRSI